MTDDLGDRIRHLREQMGWSQKHLAGMVGVTSKTVSNWERGENLPRASIGRLEQVLRARLIDDSPAGTDAVEQALRSSRLIEWRQDAVLAEYKRNLHEQGEEVRGA